MTLIRKRILTICHDDNNITDSLCIDFTRHVINSRHSIAERDRANKMCSEYNICAEGCFFTRIFEDNQGCIIQTVRFIHHIHLMRRFGVSSSHLESGLLRPTQKSGTLRRYLPEECNSTQSKIRKTSTCVLFCLPTTLDMARITEVRFNES